MGKAAWSFRPSLLISILRVTRKRTVALRVDGGGGSAVPLEGKGPWVGAWQLHFARCRGLKAANQTVYKTVKVFFEDKHRNNNIIDTADLGSVHFPRKKTNKQTISRLQ